MKKFVLIFMVAGLLYSGSYAQVFMTRTGFIGFYSKTTFEDIKAENNQVYAVIDTAKKNLAFSLLLKGFIFPKELMQEHFNENYVESDKYPKAVFTGSYTVDPNSKEILSAVTVKGKLILHQVTKEIALKATLELKAGVLSAKATFRVKPEDYGISIPSVVRDKIDKEITVDVHTACNPVK